MDALSAIDYLEIDPRPTLYWPLHNIHIGEEHRRNKALRQQLQLLDILDQRADNGGARKRIRDWIIEGSRDADNTTINECVDGHNVFGFTVQGWRIVQWQPVRATSSNIRPQLFEGESYQELLADRKNANEKLASVAAVMEMIDVGFYEYDMDGRLLQGNDAFYKLSGHPRFKSRNELSQYSWADCLYDEDKDWVFSHWEMLVKGTATTFEMKWKRPSSAMPNGEEDQEGQWVLAACVPIRGEDGKVTSICGCITDIAVQKRFQRDAVQRAEALERAYASEKRFSRFCQYANVAIAIVDSTFKMTYCNLEWFELIGHPVVEPEMVEWSEYVAPEDLAYVYSKAKQVLNHKEPIRYSFRLRRTWQNGQGGTGPTWLMACAYPELNEDGSIRAIAATLVDISYLKWAESVQRQRTDEAVEARRQQEYFIDFTCHEIRNPLSAVIHCADLVDGALRQIAAMTGSMTFEHRQRYDDLCKEIEDATDTIMSCSTHQKRIMDDILTLSKLDSKLLTISPSPVQLEGILETIEKMFEADAKKADISWRVEHDYTNVLRSSWVALDTGRLTQVLINLLTNALKFTATEPVREVSLSVTASRRRLSDSDFNVSFVTASTMQERDGHLAGGTAGEEVYLYFVVKDTGCGLGPEQQGKIFERFSQASPRTHSKYGGSGLGLFITRELIEMQGGEIGVFSQPGKGATFAFYIKAHTTDDPRASAEVEVPIRPRPQSVSVKYTILVVEDNLVNQKVLRKQLEKLKHRVFVASHGVEALDFLKTTSSWAAPTTNSTGDVAAEPIELSVVLMDVEMPVMGGIECARKIRELQVAGQIRDRLPIIAVTANARREQVAEAIEAGMDDAITKPFRLPELLPKIERVIGINRPPSFG